MTIAISQSYEWIVQNQDFDNNRLSENSNLKQQNVHFMGFTGTEKMLLKHYFRRDLVDYG